jgi:hypothetical protein
VELHGSNRIETKSKSSEELSNNLTEMVKFYEKTDFESKRSNRYLPRISSLPPSDKEIEIQKYTDKNRQYSSNVQYQQKIGSEEFISHSKKDLEIIRKKLIDIKSSAYSRKDKCNNRQTKSTGNERRLSIKRKDISKNLKNVAMLSKGGSLCVQKELIDKDIYISNPSGRSRQHRKRLKTKLVKHKRTHSSTSTDPSSTESIEEISRRREDGYIDNFFLEGPSMDRFIKKANYFDYSTGEIRKGVNQGKGYGKERTPTVTREPKCILVKEFVLYYENKGIKVFNSSAKGKEEYCGLCQLSRIASFALSGMKNPYFLLLQEIFNSRVISIIDALLN